jgi:hypothetical protein
MRISFQNELLTASYHSSAARKRNEILGFWSASTLPTTLLTLVDTRSRFCLVLLSLTRLFVYSSLTMRQRFVTVPKTFCVSMNFCAGVCKPKSP